MGQGLINPRPPTGFSFSIIRFQCDRLSFGAVGPLFIDVPASLFGSAAMLCSMSESLSKLKPEGERVEPGISRRSRRLIRAGVVHAAHASWGGTRDKTSEQGG
jgi:hypothetical protein